MPPPPPVAGGRPPVGAGPERLVGRVVAAAGLAALLAAAVAAPGDARAAADQVWSPFVLVAGLLLVGLVADEDGLFAATGHRLASATGSGVILYAGSAALVAGVTALLNLDTAVAFLTPVLVHAARRRGEDETALLYACIFLANAGSLFLPGSNLTNLIVLGHLHLSGGEFLARLWAPGLAAVVVTAAAVALAHRRALGRLAADPGRPDRYVLGLGLAAVVVSAALVLVLRAPALPVLVVGLTAVGLRLQARREKPARVAAVLGLPLLAGLFGVAVALGALGRVWSGPARLLAHTGSVGTAVVAAATSVLVNNLPAAALLAARTPPHPFSLLVGLDLGPNLLVTGSLAWLLWLRSARAAGAAPSWRGAARLGLVVAPLGLAAALGALALTGTR